MAERFRTAIRWDPESKRLHTSWTKAALRVGWSNGEVREADFQYGMAMLNGAGRVAASRRHRDRGIQLMEAVCVESKRPKPRDGLVARIARRAEAAFLRAGAIASREEKRERAERLREDRRLRWAPGVPRIMAGKTAVQVVRRRAAVALEVALPGRTQPVVLRIAPATAKVLAARIATAAAWTKPPPGGQIIGDDPRPPRRRRVRG